MSETTVGGVVGFMRLDATQFHEEMAKAIAETEALDGKNVNVKVDTRQVERLGTTSRQTSSDVDQMARSTDRAAKSADNLGKSNEQAAKSSGLLVAAILGLGPGLVPLTGLAVGAGAALGAMGATGLLAVKGIEAQMKAGTATGRTYTGVMLEAKSMLGQLETVAARNVLAPVLSSVSLLKSQMPALTGEVSSLSMMLGKVAGSSLTALLASFHALQPLIADVSVYFVGLASRLATFAQGNGFQTFVTWMRSNLPAAEQALEAIVQAAIHLVAAFAPLGGGVLQLVTALADAINAMPVSVLSTLATLGVSVFAGFKTWSTLAPMVKAVGSAMEFVGASAETAAMGMNAVKAAAGVIGVAVAAVSMIMTHNAEANRQAQQAANDYADALRQSNGVIDENIRLKAFQTLQDNGAIDAAKRLGISLTLVTSAALGNKAASADLATAIQQVIQAQNDADSGGKKTGRTAAETNDALVKLTTGVGTNTEAFVKGTQQQKDWAAANKSGADATSTQAQILANTTTALEQYRLAHESSTEATKDDTKALNALNQAMDTEISRALTLAGATSSYDMAVLNMTETLKKNGGALKETTKAGVEDRQAIEATVSALQQKRDQEIKTGTSTAAATAEYQKNSGALLDQMGKLYGTKSAAYQYAQQLLAIPKNVTSTLSLNGANAALTTILSVQNALANLPKVQDIVIKTTNVTASISASNQYAKQQPPGGFTGGTITGGGIEHHANGGEIGRVNGSTVAGSGGPKADDQFFLAPNGKGLIALSTGEKIVPNGPAQKHAALIDAMIQGKFAAGGTVGMPTGALDWSGIMAIVQANAPTASALQAALAKVPAARNTVVADQSRIASLSVAQAQANRAVVLAQAQLAALERSGHRVKHGSGSHAYYTWSGPNAAQILAAQDRLTNAHDRQRAAVTNLHNAEVKLSNDRRTLATVTAAAAAAQREYSRPLSAQFISATGSRNKVTAAFLSNIATLAKRGYKVLAADLLNQGDADAMTLAAQAVRSTGIASQLQAGFVGSQNLSTAADKLKTQLGVGGQSMQWFGPTAPGQSATSGHSVQVTVNPSAGMNEAQLASYVVQHLTMVGA